MTEYFPVSSDFTERIDRHIRAREEGPVHYFRGEEDVAVSTGTITQRLKNEEGEFLLMDNGTKIRLDTIIALLGRPGPAYDSYAEFSNSCMDSNVKDG